MVQFVYEAMEAHGGAGYVEESVMPRLFRQEPLNSIWEGSGNVICLDVLRALAREPDSMAAFLHELEAARGAYAAIDGVKDNLCHPPAEALEAQWFALPNLALVQAQTHCQWHEPGLCR